MPESVSISDPSKVLPGASNALRTGGTWVLLAGLVGFLLVCFGDSFTALWTDHWQDPQYSHGYWVPVLAVVLAWARWDRAVLQPFQDISLAERWCGVGLLTSGLALRLFAAHLGMEVPDMLALLPCLAGVVLLVGGWRLLRWASPIIAFLGFMFPLPWSIAQSLFVPLQTVATTCSTYLLQAMGYGGYREGNIIHVAGMPMQIIDACSGLRMLTVFLALCAAVALLVQRPWWERCCILASAVPIALAVNIVRITATGMAYYHSGGEASLWVETVFHNQAGLLMMPLAMILLALEVLILRHVTVDGDPIVRTSHPQGRHNRKRSLAVAVPHRSDRANPARPM